MVLLLFFLIGVTLAFFLAPDWPLAATLLVSMAAVLFGWFALFGFYGKKNCKNS